MTAGDVYVRALALLDEINEDGTPNEKAGYTGKAPYIIDAVQREVAFHAGVSVSIVFSLDDELGVSDDYALRIMPCGVAAEFALQDKMADEYQKNYAEYKNLLTTVRAPLVKHDPYNLLEGMQ